MQTVTLVFGALYGMLAVVLGALGAHRLKKVLSAERLTSFETGVKYQMYHAILLIVIGLLIPFDKSIAFWISTCFMTGVLLFSGSIYLLSLQEVWRKNLRFLGPVTPLGGLLMGAGWFLLLIYFVSV